MNRERGRLPGQLTLRVKFEDVVGGWFDYLFASPEELADLAESTGWRIHEMTESDPSYMAVLQPS